MIKVKSSVSLSFTFFQNKFWQRSHLEMANSLGIVVFMVVQLWRLGNHEVEIEMKTSYELYVMIQNEGLHCEMKGIDN